MIKSAYSEPRGMAQIWMDAFRLIGRCWQEFLCGLLVFAATSVAVLYLMMPGLSSSLLSLPLNGSSLSYTAALASHVSIELLVVLVLWLCFVITVWWVLVNVAVCRLQEKSVTLWGSFSYILSRLHWVLLSQFLYLIAVALGCLLFVLPGIYLGYAIIFCTYFVVFGQDNPVAALKSSFRLVLGNWWRVFAVFVIPGLVLQVLSYIPLGLEVLDMEYAGLVIGIAFWLFYVVYMLSVSVCMFNDLLARQAAKGTAS